MGDRTSIEAPSSRTWKYQVFLSFRGEDTRKGFTGHLHAALSDAGIRAFLDDNELERTEYIKNQLEQAIHGSMISIIVFSKRYADSSWCLDELVKIMECRERLGQKVFPLFYNVDASDVRNQTGSFAQAFEKHEAGICEGKHEKEKVQRWKTALKNAADMCGEDLKNADNGHEAKFIKKVLGEINKKLYSKYQLDIEHLVGITSRLKVLSNHLDIENSGSKDVVRMIGILGMGGIGKTTLATAIYNKFEGSFEGRSFLANVREVIAHQAITGLVGLQEQLLNDILKSQGMKVGSVAKGIDMIRARLCCKRALVIIDDADDLQQLKAIAGARDWFGPGSRIVITTRNKHLLEQVGVDSTYMAEEMDEKEALELFSWHAFKRDYPDQEYLDLSKRVIHYCQGLPLAIQVVGSFLIKRSIAEWESHLEKLERSPDGDIQKILRISFDGLPDQEKREIFLDISCFFIGMDRDYVTQILKGCGFAQTIGISVLIERCLVTVSEENKLMMHDLLRDMGREIVYENAQGHCEKFSRLRKREDVTDVLSDESGTEEIEGVALDLPWSDKASFSAEAFTNMKKLRLLDLSNVELTGEYKDFPKKLIWLRWPGFPLESIPDDFPMQAKLVALDLHFSKLKIVWKDCKLHQNLKIINLSYSLELTKLPDFSKLPNLEELILEGCESLSQVHPSIGDLGRLSLVNLKGCKKLRDLPLNFYKSKSLTTLKADETAIRQLPNLSHLSQLQEYLSLNMCQKLHAIPDLPTNLKVLEANGCLGLKKIPDFSEMTNIRTLCLSDSDKLTEIPGLEKSLNSLTRIHMENCTNLTADFRKNILQGWTSCGYGGIFLSENDIPDWFHYVHDDDIVYFTVPPSVGRNLKGLTLSFVYSSFPLFSGHISIKNLTKGTELDARIIPDSLTRGWDTYYVWQGQLSNDELKLQDGDKILIEIITEDKYGFGNPEVKKTGVSLVWDKFMNESMIDYHLCAYERRPYLVNDDDIIHVEDDNRITKSPDFSKFPNLEKLILKGCKELIKVHSCIGDLGRLSLVDLEGCRMLKDLPLNFYKSKSIETLILNGCSSFKDLADGLGDMVSLTILKADNTRIRQIPSSIVKLKKLRILSLCGCFLNEDRIPKDLCSLISLEDLLLEANSFRSLPSLAGLSKLKVLCVNACKFLCAIPDLPTNLYVLKANGCPKLETIPDFSKMSNMRELYLSDSSKLTEVPGLDKSLNSMTRIHMEGCTNLTADFRNNILQRWTSYGFGGIYLNGIYDIPEWFKIVNDVDNIVFFEVPQRIMGRDLKGLTICFVCSSDRRKLEDSEGPISIIVRNLTKQIALHTKIAFASIKSSSEPEEPEEPEDNSTEPEDPEEPEDDSSEPEEPKNDSSEPEEPKNDSSEPEEDSIEPEEPEDDSSEPEDDSSEPEVAEDDSSEPEVPEDDSSEPEEPKDDSSEPEEPKDDSSEPEVPEDDSSEPEEPEDDSIEPEDDSSEPEDDSSEPEEDSIEPEDDSSEPEVPEDDSSEPEDDYLSQGQLSNKPEDDYLLQGQLSNEPEDHYLWHGQLSNDMLRLQGGDQVTILVRPLVDFVRVKKTGVHLEWDKLMKENMDNPDAHLYDLETNRDFLAVKPYLDFLGGTDDEARPSHDASVPGDQVSAIDEESAVEDDPLGHGDLSTRLSLSIMENLDFSGGADDGAGRSHGAFVRTNQSSVVDKQLEWDKVMKENMENLDPHLYDLETNQDFSGGVDDAFFRGSVIHEQLAVEPYLGFLGGTDNEAGRSHDAFVRNNQSSAVEGCFAHLKSFLFNLFFNCFSHPR